MHRDRATQRGSHNGINARKRTALFYHWPIGQEMHLSKHHIPCLKSSDAGLAVALDGRLIYLDVGYLRNMRGLDKAGR